MDEDFGRPRPLLDDPSSGTLGSKTGQFFEFASCSSTKKSVGTTLPNKGRESAGGQPVPVRRWRMIQNEFQKLGHHGVSGGVDAISGCDSVECGLVRLRLTCRLVLAGVAGWGTRGLFFGGSGLDPICAKGPPSQPLRKLTPAGTFDVALGLMAPTSVFRCVDVSQPSPELSGQGMPGCERY